MTSVRGLFAGLEPGGVSLAFPKDRFPLHAMVTSAGYDACVARPYDWHGLRRGEAPFVLLQHTLSGRGRLRYENRRFDLSEGQTMLLRFPHDNRYWLARGERWEFFYFLFNGREILRLWHALGSVGPVVTLPEASVAVLARHCLGVLQGGIATPAQSSATAYAVAMQLADDLLPWGAVRSQAKRPAAIERALSLTQGSPSEPLDVERLARAAGYSRYHFSRVFAAHEGVSPGRYLMRQRMEEASRLLRAEDLSVKEIAHRCGFADANYFTKVFRRYFGMAPKDFRRSGMFGGQPPAP